MTAQETLELEYVSHVLQQFNAYPSTTTAIVSPPSYPHHWSSCAAVLLWNPILSHNLTIFCTACKTHSLHFEHRWNCHSSIKYRPRLLFNYGRNVRLVSSEYTCSDCKRTYIAHSEDVLNQIPKNIEPGFILFHQCGLTQTAYNLVVDSIVEGKKIVGPATIYKTASRLYKSCTLYVRTLVDLLL
jgi:hypothetical protein